MAVAHMTCYQHFISKISTVHARFKKQTPRGPALSLSGPRRSLCRGPTLCVPGSGALCQRSPALSVRVCVGAKRSTLDALCVGPRRSLLCVGPGAFVCVPPMQSAAQFHVPPIRPQTLSGTRVPPIRSRSSVPQLRSTCHTFGREPPAQIRLPLGAFPFSRREPQTLLFRGKQTDPK